MKFLRVVFTAVSCAVLVVPAIAQFPQAWSKFADLGRPESQAAFHLLPVPGGGYVAMSYDMRSSSVWRISDTGAVVWEHTVPGTNGGLAVNSTGVAVTCGIFGLGNFQATNVAKYDLAGNLLWATTSVGVGTSDEIAMDAAGNVVVQRNSTIVKFDASTGATVFTKTLGGEPYYFNLACDANGATYAAVDVLNPFGTVLLYKLDANGQQVWVNSFAGALPSGTLDASGNYYLTYSGVGVEVRHVAKIDTAGTVVYDTSYSASDDSPRIAVSSTGALMTATTEGSDIVRRFNSAGALIW